jgi:hypothetical protein
MKFRRRSMRTNELPSETGATARQLTALVAFLIVAIVMIPYGAQAAQTVGAIITDADGTNQAHVDSSGNLLVSDSGGRRLLVGQNVSVGLSGWDSAFFDTHDCSSLELFMDGVIGTNPAVALMAAATPASSDHSTHIKGSPLGTGQPQPGYAFLVQGTSAPVVAPFAGVHLEDLTGGGSIRVSEVWLECGP